MTPDSNDPIITDDAFDKLDEPKLAATPFDDADFKEFDSAPVKQSLGDIWANNPFLKIGVILGGVILLVGGFLMFGNSEKPVESNVQNASTETQEAPGGQVSENYRGAIEEVNQQRLENALDTGASAIPIPLAAPTTPDTFPPTQPEVPAEDPLAQWRAAAQAPAPTPSAATPAVDPFAPQSQLQKNNAAAAQPVENPYTQIMAQQMGNILGAQTINPPKIMQVTSAGYLESLNAAKQAQVEAQAPKDETTPIEILIAAGSLNYATMLLEANSDVPGPVMGRLQSGPFAGSKILGSFESTDDYLTITFNTVIINGESRPINAVAINPNTTLPALASETDSRYLKRVILPAAAEFLTGFADAVTDYGTTNVTVSGDTVATETPKLNTEEQIYAGLGKGVEVIGEDLNDRASKTKPLVKVTVGAPLGVLFLEPVLKEE